MATNSSTSQPQPANAASIITALGNAFKSQSGEPMAAEKIAQLLVANMSQLGELTKQGKLNQLQILQLKEFADKQTKTATTPGPSGANATAGPSNSNPVAGSSKQQPQQQPQSDSHPGPFKSSSPAPVLSANSGDGYPISSNLQIHNPGAVPWASAQQGRPTLTGGIAGGRMSGTPAQIARGTDDVSMLNLDDYRSRRKNTPGDQSMRRSIQDLVASIDPNVKIEPEVEDLLLSIADEFIDSVTNFSCRLAKHRGGDTLEVRDLQLHLERNHNIRIPGFASDETRISLSQSSVAPAVPPVAPKKTTQGTHMTLRSHRLSQVQQAKKDAKLL